ncbi:MAG: D-2-hydroxyacid dehydrogenase [Alphaproteobacteria bacterium]|nr:D-2-hydroxyacid dehydrogenase [Alphaproteobacteria bacterium]
MQPTVFIATPLEDDQVVRIFAAAEGRAIVVHEPDLLPPVRYVADHKGRADFVRTAEQQERWKARLAEADFLWDIPPLDGLPLLGRKWAPKLQWVQTTSSGVGPTIEKSGLAESGAIVTTAKGIHAEPLSEFVLLAILMHVKRLRHLQAEQAAHRWQRYCGEALTGKTVAIVGAGEVGHRVAQVCKFMGMRVLAMSRRLTANEGQARGYDGVFSRTQMAEVFATADAVVLAVPHTSETERMIDAEKLAAMKPDAILVNIARGQVVDESALIDAVQNHRIGFAALDVAQTEPLPVDSPLWDHPNVLISPHSASTVVDENRKITDIFIHNMECLLDNRQSNMKNVFDKSQLY